MLGVFSVTLDIIIALMIFYLVHRTNIYKPQFVLYFCLLIKWVFFLATDVAQIVDFGTIANGFSVEVDDWLLLVFPKLVLLIGLGYTILRTLNRYTIWKSEPLARLFKDNC